MYIAKTQDADFIKRRLPVLKDCLTSLVNRDHPDPAKRTGIMQCDAARTASGAEITTYDSLDTSLGQARENLYIGGKCWASYLALEKILGDAGDAAGAQIAREQAQKAAETMTAAADAQSGLLPAIIGLSTPNPPRIIPAVEALVYPALYRPRGRVVREWCLRRVHQGTRRASPSCHATRRLLVRKRSVEAEQHQHQLLAQQDILVPVRCAGGSRRRPGPQGRSRAC